MAKPNLTPKVTIDRLKDLLSYDPDTGLFTRRVRVSKKAKAGQIAGCNKLPNGYIKICVDYESHFAHRLAWFYMTRKWPAETIDHINGIRDDNRFMNLREATVTGQCENQRRPQLRNKVGLLGVRTKNGRSFHATIQVKGKYMYLGCFPTAEKAYEVYLNAKRKLHEYGTL